MSDSLFSISVIIPVYNGENFIAEAIDCVLDQDYRPLEIIVINDCSTDNTEHIVNTFGDKVTFITNEKNSGASFSRNAGIRAATYNYIAFLDADDLWLPNKLKLQIQAIKNSNHAQFCYSHTLIRPFDKVGALSLDKFVCDVCHSEEKTLLQVFENPYFNTSSIIINKKLCFEIGLFRDDLKTAEDIDFCLKAAELTTIVAVKEPLVVYRRVDNSLGSSINSYQDNLTVIEDFLKRNKGFKQQHKKIVAKIERKIFDDWISDLVVNRQLNQAMTVIKSSIKIVMPTHRTIILLIKVILLKMVKDK